MSLKKCEECGKPLLPKHEDTDKLGRRVQWFRCGNGHWKSELIKNER